MNRCITLAQTLELDCSNDASSYSIGNKMYKVGSKIGSTTFNWDCFNLLMPLTLFGKLFLIVVATFGPSQLERMDIRWECKVRVYYNRSWDLDFVNIELPHTFLSNNGARSRFSFPHIFFTNSIFSCFTWGFFITMKHLSNFPILK